MIFPHLCRALHCRDNSTGSHVAPFYDQAATHPDEIVAEVPARSAIMINAHTWHAGTTNRSGARRRVLHGYYTAREHPQQQDQRRWIREETLEWLSAEQRWLLDVD